MTGIFLDLDGTLLNDSNNISQEDFDFIKNNKDKYKFYFSTGKSFSSIFTLYSSLELDTWLITSQGTLIIKPSTNEVIKNFIDEKDLKIIESMKFNNIVFDMNEFYYQRGFVGIDLSKNKKRINTIKNVLGIYIKTNNKIVTSLDMYKWDIGNNKTVKILRPNGINKEMAMKEIIKKDKLSKTIFIGNGRADINSIKQADIGISMINAHKNVKDSAKIITKFDNNNSGVSKILNKIL